MVEHLKEVEKKLDDCYIQHKKLKRSVNKCMDWLVDDVDELFAMKVRNCNCSKKSINSSSETSASRSSEEFNSDYALPKKKIHKVKKKSSNKKVKSSSCRAVIA